MLIDTHAHLTFPELAADLDGVLARARAAGVDRIISVAGDAADAGRAWEIAGREAMVSCTAGIHPHEAAKAGEDDFAAVAALLSEPQVVGVGEIGLDYFYDFADRETQLRVLARQLEIAAGHDLPLIVHCREAFDDTIGQLVSHGFRGRPVVFHCFTGSGAEARRVADHGWRLSFTGIVTFRKSTELQAIAREYPADKLMVETDSPYLSPEPVRGMRPNEPANLGHTARFLAGLRGVSFEDLAAQTAENSRRFFGLAE